MNPPATLPFLTASLPHLAGVYKARWEDFVVEEIPGREPAGHGDHVWLEVEKRGLATPRAAGDLARALGVKPSAVGYAGMKDARAITRQWMSVEHVAPERALALEVPRLRVLRAVRHPRKLRRGWHAGNRFAIRLRSPSAADPAADPAAGPTAAPAAGPTAAPAAGPTAGAAAGLGARHLPVGRPGAEAVAAELLELLGRRGVPNYYGPQRFGSRGDTWRVGRALARGAWEEAAALVAGRPLRPGDPGLDPAAGVFPDVDDILRARELYDAGRWLEAAEAWPRGFGQCARLARAMERTGGDAARAVAVLGKRMLRLYASAYQSWLFNAVLAERVACLDTLLPGDLAWKHDTEALFLVDDPALEQPRADAFEISPTGPLVGRRMREPSAEAAAFEAAVLEAAGLQPADLESRAMAPLGGSRRPLRFPLRDAALQRGDDDLGPFIEIRFALPPGCYATAVLRELGGGEVRERQGPSLGGPHAGAPDFGGALPGGCGPDGEAST